MAALLSFEVSIEPVEGVLLHFEIKLVPAGKANLMTWQEKVGYIQGGKQGIPIEIKAGEVTDLGKIELKPKD